MSLISRFFSALLAPFRIVLTWFAKLIPGLKKIPAASVPTRFALLTFLILLIFAVTWHVRLWLIDDPSLAGSDWVKSPWTIAAVIGLTFMIPLCVYAAIKIFMEGVVSEFEEIDRAWKLGLDALRDNGIDLTYTPLFVVIGSSGDEFAARLHQASMIPMDVSGAGGNSPLQWYASQDAIFLHLTDACCLSRLAQNAKSSGPAPRVAGGKRAGMQTIRGDIGGALESASPSKAGSQTLSGGISPGTERADEMAVPASRRAMQTLQPGALSSEPDQPLAAKATISTSELDEFESRLIHVCKLIGKHRYPVCPINGALTVVSFSMLQTTHDQAQIAWQRDLETIARETRMQFPNTVLVSEMETESGFLELIRRIGTDATKHRRFGKGFGSGDVDVWTPPTTERVRALARLSCRAFEDNIYDLFSRQDALQKPGNGKLYSLLSKVRGGFDDRLESFLVNGMSKADVMMTGCYFAATGDREDRQAFVQSVIDERVMGNQDKIAWDDSAAVENQRFLTLSNLCVLIALLSFIALVAMVVMDIWFAEDAAKVKQWLPF